MGKLKDKFAKLVRGPGAVWDKTVSDPQQKHPTTRAFTDSAEADGIPISKPDRVVVQSTNGANVVQPAVMYEAAQPATPSEAVHVGMRVTALFDKPPLPAGQHVNSHLVSVASQLTGSDHSTLPAAEPLGRHSLTEASEVSTVAKPSSLSDGIPPAFETTSSYDGSATAAMSGIGRRFSIHLQTARSGASLHPAQDLDAEIELIMDQLQQGTVEDRGSAAEKLFNKAAEDEAARQKAAAAGVIQPLVHLLRDGKERGRMYAGYALSSIISANTDMTELRTAGAIPALVAVLNTSKVVASKKGAMRALGRVVRSDEAANEVVAAGGLVPIVKLLDCNDPGVVRRCLMALYYIGADKEVLQAEIMSAGAVPGAVKLCSSSHPEIQAEAADLLKVLARSPRAAATVVQDGALPALAMVAGEGLSERAQVNATKAIQRLAAMPSVQAMVRSSPAGRFLDQQAAGAAALNTGRESVELARHFDQGQQLIQPERESPGHEAAPRGAPQAGKGLVPPLVHLLLSGGPSDQARAARALSNMATDSSVKEQIVAAGAVPLLIGIVRDGSNAVQSAVVALEKLCSHSTGSEAVLEHGGIAALVNLLRGAHMEAWASATHTLHMLCSSTPSATTTIMQAGGVPALMHACVGSSAELQTATLTVMRQLVVQPLGPSIFLTAQAIPMLAMLQHSLVAEVKILATKILDRIGGSSRVAEEAVTEEQQVQGKVDELVEQLRVAVVVPPTLEAAFRLIPRSAFTMSHAADRLGGSAMFDAGAHLGDLQTEALSLQALSPEQGQTFLDVGSGTGYLTMVAANLVGHSGKAVGLEVEGVSVEFAAGKLHEIQQSRGLPTLTASFMRGNLFTELHSGRLGELYDCLHVGGSCNKDRIRELLRLVKPGGRMTVPCEGQLLLLTPPFEDQPLEPIVLGSVTAYPGLVDEHGTQMSHEAFYGNVSDHSSHPSTTVSWRNPNPVQHPWTEGSNHKAMSRESAASGRTVLHGGVMPGGPPVAGLPSDQLHQEARMAARYDQGDAASSLDAEEAEGEAHGWLIAREDISICRTSENKKCRLGEGGFGIVYKALMNGVDEVAIKLVKAEKPTTKELTLFHKEVRVLRTLHHRNIVQFYGACLEPTSMFFVTELMKGGDLYSALRNHPDTMKWDRLGRKVALDVALGINYLHTRRPPMMHRDLKSPNVLLSEEGVAKIADVGMVRPQVQELVTAQPIMTPLWAAPEVVRHERASVKADMWSYGILVWELISDQDITNLQPLAIAQAMQAGTTKSLQLPAGCPPVAARIFTECTHTEPDCRPSAQQVVEWLRQA